MIMAHFIFSVFIIVVNVFKIIADKSCDGDQNSTVCVDERGFYFLVGNGTWSISLIDGDGIEERDSFLKHLGNLNCLSSTSNVTDSESDNESCFCELGFPILKHPITHGLVLPPSLSCKRQLYHSFHNAIWHPSTTYIEQCKFQGPVLFPFLCVSLNNLKETGWTYNNPQSLSKSVYLGEVQSKISHLNWRNITLAITNLDFNKNNTSGKSNRSTIAKMGKSIQEDNTNVTFVQAKLMDGVYFRVTTMRKTEELEEDLVVVEVNPANNQTVNFTAPTECLSKQRKWDVFPLCQFTIHIGNISDCKTLRGALNVSIAVIFQHIANINEQIIEEYPTWDSDEQRHSNSSMDNEDSSEQEDEDEENGVICTNLPSHVYATEVWAVGQHIVTILSYETSSYELIGNTYHITGATSQKIISEADYTTLSSFWAKFHFGDCLYRRCWRDLLNIVPLDMLQHSKFMVGNEGEGYLGLRYIMPVLILCFVVLVRNCIVNCDEDIL